MKAILFTGRVAFIFNIMFVVYLLGHFNFISNTSNNFTGFILATGFLLPLLVNAIFFTAMVIRLMTGKRNDGIPGWLKGANFIFYAVQIVFFFIA
jgi:hypothetical protein